MAADWQSNDDFSDTLWSHNHRDTSKYAASKMAPKAGSLRARVLDVIIEARENGLCNTEIASICNMNVDTAKPRAHELWRRRLIYPFGKRQLPGQHRPQQVWVSADLVPQDRKVLCPESKVVRLRAQLRENGLVPCC